MNQNCSSLNYCIINIKQHYCRLFSLNSNHFFAALLSVFFATAFTSLKIANFFLILSKILKRKQAD